MSLPKPGQVFLTGKAFLQQGRRDVDNPCAVFYEGQVDCRRRVNDIPTVHCVFRQEVDPSEEPLCDGVYNVSAKVCFGTQLHHRHVMSMYRS